MDVEGIVGDEQEGAVPVGRSAMLHDAAFREPDEAAGSESALVRGEAAFKYVDAVGAGVNRACRASAAAWRWLAGGVG